MDHGFNVGDLIRCWHLEHIGFCFSIGIIMKLDVNYAKVCLQDTGEVVWIAYRSMYLIKKSKDPFNLDKE
tara:strand:+ start:616 stop:825 length:210 start_codon:yes stop_codon:yes gene_type:complete